MSRTKTILFPFVAASLFGQTTTTPSKEAHGLRRTPPAAQSQKTFVDTFDFDANVKALQQVSPVEGELQPPTLQVPKTGTTPSVPKGYRPPVDVTLSSTAQQAVQFSANWRAQQNAAAPGPDGRVLLAFGAGLPTVVCAPLRVCLIELQPGEKLEGEPQIGDSVRWNVSPATYGKGDDSTAVLVLKPQMPGLDTNLLITTDRRAYYVRLVSCGFR